MTYQHSQFHGTHIATAEMPHMESVSVAIYLPVGSRYESAEQNGIAHFLEHMIFKGTSSRSALDIALQIEGAGGTMNAFTNEDQTCLETRGPAELLPLLIEIMADMLWNSNFDPTEVEREREVIAEEIVMYQENPGDHLHDLLSEALYPSHPLGRPITGTEDSIKNITSEDLKAFALQHYHSQGVTLSVAGNVKHADVYSLAEKFLPELNNPKCTFPEFKLSTPLKGNQPALIHDQRDIEQTHLAIAFHTDGRHSENRHILRIMSLIMGETMSSRLFQELRENRGLCYHVASDYSMYHDTGTFEIHLGLDSSRLKECIELIQLMLEEICLNGFTPAELKQAVVFSTTQSRIGMETPQAHMSWMGDSLLCFDKIIDPKSSREALSTATLSALQQLAQLTFKPENMAISTVGPQSLNEIKLALKPLTQ